MKKNYTTPFIATTLYAVENIANLSYDFGGSVASESGQFSGDIGNQNDEW